NRCRCAQRRRRAARARGLRAGRRPIASWQAAGSLVRASRLFVSAGQRLGKLPTGLMQEAMAPLSALSDSADHYEWQYLALMRRIWDEGCERVDRTGVGTRALFGAELRFDLSEGRVPLLTT